jgi:hypothetical protein
MERESIFPGNKGIPLLQSPLLQKGGYLYGQETRLRGTELLLNAQANDAEVSHQKLMCSEADERFMATES